MRMRLSPKLRFEIFKRDQFTCRYCGRRTPDVVLEIDHVVPVAEGGSDDPENLVTACYECNRGKGATPLEVIPVGEDDVHYRTILLAERELQLREYNTLMRRVREREEQQAKELVDYWCALWYLDPQTARHFEVPNPLRLERYLQRIAAEDIARAMRVCATKPGLNYPSKGCNYLYGILQRWLREGVRF